MSGRTILKVENPTTQTVESVKSLLVYVGRASDPLPTEVSLENGRLVLVLSNKKDAYYTVTARACSCPGNQFRHNCKHMRRYFPQETAKLAATEPGSIKPAGKWPGGMNGPVDECRGAA